MAGNVLYPMSELLDKHPNLFALRERHHEHQPRVLEGSIPRLGCFWRDTLHFTALHPQKIAEALNRFGYNIKLKYYEIEAKKLSSEKTIVFLNKSQKSGTPTKVSDFVLFDPNEVEKFAYIPEESMNYYQKNIPTSDEFLLNYRNPYILYKGNFNIEGAKIIEA
ncbi:MAG: hypothetical protein Q7R65_02050 [bacterium]|nr:hypothetical protein [bacterium]